MVVFDLILLLLGLSLGIAMTYSDIKTGLIPNKYLLLYTFAGLLVDITYYGVFCRDVAVIFVLNVITVIMIDLVLYYSRSIAGGDCKLIIVMSLLYPAGMYITYRKSSITLFASLGIAILAGYVFMLVSALWKVITGENKVDKTYIKQSFLTYIRAYLRASVYVILINLVLLFIVNHVITIADWMIWLVCMTVAWISNRITVLKNRVVLAIALVAVIVLSIVERVIPLSVRPGAYLFTAALMLCQLTIRTDLYETIPAVHVRKGMILSTFSSMAMQNSRVKGLPGLSSEDLRDRLTEEQAESVRRWGKTENNIKEITVVKKVPFAVFVFIGFLGYFMMWRTVS